jgi:hypothetical protein
MSLIERLMTGRLTEADRRTLAEHYGRRDGDRLPIDGRSSADLREANRPDRIEQLAAWAETLFDQGRKDEHEIAAILLDSMADDNPDADAEVEAAMKKAKRRWRRTRKPDGKQRREAVLGRSDAGARGEVDVPDSGLGEDDDDDEIGLGEEAWARNLWAEERLGISHAELAEEMMDPW